MVSLNSSRDSIAIGLEKNLNQQFFLKKIKDLNWPKSIHGLANNRFILF